MADSPFGPGSGGPPPGAGPGMAPGGPPGGPGGAPPDMGGGDPMALLSAVGEGLMGALQALEQFMQMVGSGPGAPGGAPPGGPPPMGGGPA